MWNIGQKKSKQLFAQTDKTSDNRHVLRRLLERKIQEGEELYLTYIDLRAAFDTIDREEICKCLEEIKTLVKEIKSTYESVRCQIQIEEDQKHRHKTRRQFKPVNIYFCHG